MSSGTNLLRAGQIELNVVQRGQGTPLVLVHGFPLDHSMWQAQIAELSGAYRVVAPDLRGFGRSEITSGTVTMEQFADDLAAMLDALRIAEPIVLCGLSMGGYIALQFWRRHGQRLRGLVLGDTRAAADTPEIARGRRVSARQVIESGLSQLVESMVPRLFAERTLQNQPERVAALRRVMLAAPPEGVAAALRGMAERPDMRASLSGIAVPTLCLVGEHDVITPAAEMREMAAVMPNAEFREIAAAGHMAPLEQPAAVNAALREFLARV